MKKTIILLILFVLCIPIKFVNGIEMDVNAKSAVLIETSTGQILFEKEKDTRLPMASMTKIMSMLLIMEQIDNGNLSYDDKVTITDTASSMGGSQVFLQTGDVYKVSELLKCIAMASANDAVVAMAEKTYGSVENFINEMNKRAKELGLNNTNFVNVHGLDEENHYSSAYDMAKVAMELVKHEDILKYTSVYEEYLQKMDGSQIWLVNTNKLVRFYEGVDGLKTGYTGSAGYCLTATAKKNNLRLISVVMGEDSIEKRSQDTVKLLNYGFNLYKINTIKSKGQSLGKTKVLKGKENEVEIILKDDATELLKVNDKKSDYNFNLKINKIIAPVKKGDIVGYLEIKDKNNKIINKVNVTVKNDVLKANLWDYFINNLKNILTFNN